MEFSCFDPARYIPFGSNLYELQSGTQFLISLAAFSIDERISNKIPSAKLITIANSS